MTFTDATGRDIDLGDIIFYNTSSYNGSTPPLTVGKVVRFSAKSLWVQPHDITTLKPILVDEYYMVDDGPPKVYYAGSPSEWTHQPQRKVVTGKTEIGEQIVPKPSPEKFYILRKI